MKKRVLDVYSSRELRAVMTITLRGDPRYTPSREIGRHKLDCFHRYLDL